MSYRLRLLVASFIISTGLIHLTVNAAGNYDLPSIGQPVDTALSPLQEDEIGKDIVRQLRSFNYILEDIELRYYLQSLGFKIASFSGYTPEDFTFFIVRDRQVNAFALPGGYIGINAGLILTSSNEDELSGVIAHEIAHVTQRHIARQIESSGSFNIATIAALVVAIIAGASDPDVAQAALSLGLATSQQQRINFTRTHEAEADRVGIRTLAEAGYDPKAMATFFQKMEERGRLYGSGLPEILQSHPVSNTRISEALTRAAEYDQQYLKKHDPLPYELMKARLRVMTEPQVHDALKYFSAVIEKNNSISARYGHSLALVRTGRYEKAIPELRKLSEITNNSTIEIALARAQLSSGDIVAAENSINNAHKRFPNNSPLILSHADLYMQMGKPDEARKLLLSSNLIQSKEPEVHRILAVAARDTKRVAEAHYQMARYHQLTGEYREAINQLDAGLRNKQISENDKARLQQALNKLEKDVPERVLREIRRDRTRNPSTGYSH